MPDDDGIWWEDAARAESRRGVFDGPPEDRPSRWEIEADEAYSAPGGSRQTWPREPLPIAPDPWGEGYPS